MENEAFVNILEGISNMRYDSSGDMEIFNSDDHYPGKLRDMVELIEEEYNPMNGNHWYSITEDQNNDKLELFVKLEVLSVLFYNDDKNKKTRHSTKKEKYDTFYKNYAGFMDALDDRGMTKEWIKISELMGDLAKSNAPISWTQKKMEARLVMYNALIIDFNLDKNNAKNIAKGVYAIKMTLTTFTKKYKKSIYPNK